MDTDARTLAYINLYAILGTIPLLCALEPVAGKMISKDKVSVGFDIKGGPAATLHFADGKCFMTDGCRGCTAKVTFSSPERFNSMMDGTTPIGKGIFSIPFLHGPFQRLRDILFAYIRPKSADLKYDNFRRVSTLLLFSMTARSICCIANEDNAVHSSLAGIPDGVICISAGENPGLSSIIGMGARYPIVIKDHILSLMDGGKQQKVTSYMHFITLDAAREVFSGNVSVPEAAIEGMLRTGGSALQVDAVSTILSCLNLYNI